jgi:SnoaL-like domain
VTVTTSEIEALRQQVAVLVDRAEISDLIDRFSRDLDDNTLEQRPFDVAWVCSYFTEDASVEYPPGSATGVEAIAALIDGRGMAPFQRTHHVTTNYLIELDGDRARVRFNLIATHVHSEDARQRLGQAPDAQFMVGDYCKGEVVRTGAGWRFSRQALYVTWFDGSPPSM